MSANEMPALGTPISMTYRNHRCEIAERCILPDRVWFGSTDWHPEPGWLMTAFDTDKGAFRDFALADCQFADLCASGKQVRALTEALGNIGAMGFSDDPSVSQRIAKYAVDTARQARKDFFDNAALTPVPQPEAATPTAPASGRVKVPDGQTPLNDKLSHPLLDVFNEGIAARDNGTGSPYHGHSLEHCLHAAGWVQRDLRLALDATKVATPAAQEAEPVGWEPIHNWRPSDRGDRIRQEADGTWSRKAHQAQPSVSVAEAALKEARANMQHIKERLVGEWSRNGTLELIETHQRKIDAALRALKGGDE